MLSDQLREHLQRLGKLLRPHAAALDRQFLARLRQLQFDSKQRAALVAITPGAAARLLASGQPPSAVFEQVDYCGRRLAKLNLPPSAIVGALQEYDRILTPALRRLMPNESANFDWVREQLHFCVILTLNNAYYQVREGETHAFYELFRAELESRNLDELLLRFLRTLAEFCHACQGRLFLLDDERSQWVLHASCGGRSGAKAAFPALTPASQALRRGLLSPLYVRRGSSAQQFLLDPAWRGRFPSCWSIPLAVAGRTAGVMQFAFDKEYEWLPREQELLAAAAERCLMAAEKARLMEDLADREEQVRQLAEHMLHVEEVERRRISRELHDEAGQSMLCIRLQMEMVERALHPDQEDLRRKLTELRDQTERTIIEIRRLIAALSPAVLEQLGLGAALRQLVNRFRQLHPARVRLHLNRLDGLPKKTEVMVYRLVQECFNNIAKHSGATTVNISAATADGILRLSVEDNGVGFNVAEALAKRDSFGLSGIRERVALLGGKFEVESAKAVEVRAKQSAGARTGRPGTRIRIELPIPKEDAEARAAAHTVRVLPMR